MKVLLLTDVAKVGKRGEVHDVAGGYAENVLFPNGLARPATASAVAVARAEEERRALTRRSARTAIEAAISRLASAGFVALTARADEHGTLFEGVRADRIAAAITEETGVLVAPGLVHLAKPIKSVGDYELRVGDATTWTMVRVTVRPS